LSHRCPPLTHCTTLGVHPPGYGRNPEREEDRAHREELAAGQLEVDVGAGADPLLRQPRFVKVLEALEGERDRTTRELEQDTGLSRTSVLEALQAFSGRRPPLAAFSGTDTRTRAKHWKGTIAGHQALLLHRHHVATGGPALADPEAEERRFAERRGPEAPAWQQRDRRVEVDVEAFGPHVALKALDLTWDQDEPVIVGQLYLLRGGGDDRTFGGRAPGTYVAATNLWTSPTDEDAPLVARLLHERAAALAASWGLPLASGLELTVPHEAWWSLQAFKGRAEVGTHRGRGGHVARRWFLGYPPPASLENPPRRPVDPREVLAPFGRGEVLRFPPQVPLDADREAALRHERARLAFLHALRRGATVQQAAVAAGHPTPAAFLRLAERDPLVRDAIRRAGGASNPGADDRLRTAERALAASPDDRGAWLGLWRERLRAGRIADHALTPRGDLELAAWRRQGQATDADGRPTVRMHDAPGAGALPVHDVPAGVLWDVAGRRDPESTPAVGDVFVRTFAGTLSGMAFHEVAGVTSTLVTYYSAAHGGTTGWHAARYTVSRDEFTAMLRHNGYQPFLIAELRANGLMQAYPGWRSPRDQHAAAAQGHGLRRELPLGRQGLRLAGDDDPIGARP
jgi:hypothetical protein